MKLFFSVLLLSLVSVFARAQSAAESRGLFGRVTDPLGQPVRGALVKVTQGANFKRETTTNEEGRFVISGITVAPLSVEVTASGFATYRSQFAASAELTIRLEPAVLNETLQMREQPRILFAGQISGVEGYIEAMATGLNPALR